MIHNPCNPDIDTTNDEMLITTYLSLDAGMTKIDLYYAKNGNCRYNVTFHQASCQGVVESGPIIFEEPVVIFEKEPFIADTTDDRIVTM